ncbi:hypothetical protein BC829DRAFT_440684 [Chytridium lagenaria]|nr:hypothetical protein BC829DRAFT_440684 [Chytridium lagenaria]
MAHSVGQCFNAHKDHLGGSKDHRAATETRTGYLDIISQKDHARYLGMMMAGRGDDIVASLLPRITAARSMIGWMGAIGINRMGWRPQMSLCIFKSFICPTMEYGLALMPLPQLTLNALQEVQNIALCRIFESPQHLRPPPPLQLPTMSPCNHTLNASFYYPLHQSNDHTHIVVTTCRGLTTLPNLPSSPHLSLYPKRSPLAVLNTPPHPTQHQYTL